MWFNICLNHQLGNKAASQFTEILPVYILPVHMRFLLIVVYSQNVCDKEYICTKYNIFEQNYLPRVLDKIFSALVFTLPGETKETRSRSVKNVRRHAASLMVKIGQKYPLLLLPVFDRIKMIVSDLESKADALSRMEIVCLQVP